MSFVVHEPNFAGKRRVSHDVIISLLKSSRQKVGVLAISCCQNNGKMAERDRGRVIGVWQNLKILIFLYRLAVVCDYHGCSPGPVSAAVHECTLELIDSVCHLAFYILYMKDMETKLPSCYESLVTKTGQPSRLLFLHSCWYFVNYSTFSAKNVYFVYVNIATKLECVSFRPNRFNQPR